MILFLGSLAAPAHSLGQGRATSWSGAASALPYTPYSTGSPGGPRHAITTVQSHLWRPSATMPLPCPVCTWSYRLRMLSVHLQRLPCSSWSHCFNDVE